MKAVGTLLALIILALGAVAAWQLGDGAQAATVSQGGTYGAAIGTSVPAAATAPAATKLPYSIPLTPDPRDRVPAPEMPVTGKPVSGRPAIVPAAPDAPLGLPTFDAAMASAYALADRPWQFTFPASGEVAVARVEFLTGEQLYGRGDGGGFRHPDDRLLCLVTITGDFSTPAPDTGNARPPGPPARLTMIYILYDARTGNHLGMGGIR